MQKEVQPFDSVLRSINNGRLNNELTDELTEVLEMVRMTGRAGAITLTLKLKPRGETNQQIEVVPSVKGSKPELSRPVSIFFINRDCGLQKTDPSQHEIDGLQPVRDEPTSMEESA